MSRRIVVDLEKVVDMNSGLGQYSWHLAHELSRIDPDIFYYLPRSAWSRMDRRGRLIRQQRWHRHVRPARPRADVFHSLHQEAPYLPANRDCRYILTLHDMNVLIDSDKRPATKAVWLRLVQERVDRAQTVVFVSRYAQEIAERNLEFGAQKRSVVYNGVPIKDGLAERAPAKLPARPFLFAAATVLPKKNFHSLIPMMERLPEMQFVLAGRKDNRYARRMEEEVRRRGLGDRLVLVGPISEEEKIWYYRNSRGLVFPSLGEGFGLPVVEAMHYSLPVFLSRRCALPEVGGEDATYFDGFEPDAMAEAVTSGLARFDADPGMKDRLRSRAAGFSWAAAARKYYELYRDE